MASLALAPPPAPSPVLAAIQRAAKTRGIAWQPLAAVSHYESGLDPNAIGDGGHAFGLFQNNNAGGTITGDPNPRRFLDPNVSANYTADAIKRLGIQNLSPAQQVAAIVNRYERPAKPAPEIAGAQSFLSRLGAASSTPAFAATPARATPTAPSAAAPPSPILLGALQAQQGVAQRAQDAFSAISGVTPTPAPAIDFQTLLRTAQTAPTATTPANGKIVPLRGPGADHPSATKGLDAQGKKAVALAKQYIGTPYLYGGADPKSGFDCSGLLQYVWNKNGVKIPRTAAEQYDAAKKIPASQLKPGDAVFFSNTDGPGVTHVGMFIGNGQFIQSPHTGDHVKISKLSDPYYAAHFTAGGAFT